MQKDQLKLQLLSQEIGELYSQSNFASAMLQAFQNVENVTDEMIAHLCKALKLPLVQELATGLAFAQSPDTNTQQEGLY